MPTPSKDRGDVWNAKKDYDRAFADYDAAIRLEPGAASYYTARGTANDNRGDQDKVIADFSR